MAEWMGPTSASMMSIYSLTASGGISLGALGPGCRWDLCGRERVGWARELAFRGALAEAEQERGEEDEGLLRPPPHH